MSFLEDIQNLTKKAPLRSQIINDQIEKIKTIIESYAARGINSARCVKIEANYEKEISRFFIAEGFSIDQTTSEWIDGTLFYFYDISWSI